MYRQGIAGGVRQILGLLPPQLAQQLVQLLQARMTGGGGQAAAPPMGGARPGG